MPKKSTTPSRSDIHLVLYIQPKLYLSTVIISSGSDKLMVFFSFKGVGTNEKCLIEVLASRNNRQIHELVAAYKDGMMGLKLFCESYLVSLS